MMTDDNRWITTIRLRQEDKDNIARIKDKTRLRSLSAVVCLALQREVDRLVAEEKRKPRRRSPGPRPKSPEPSLSTPIEGSDDGA